MISFLPKIYPDELCYSWFCRYYVHSGCFTHKMALDDILYSRHNNPSKEFLGHLSLDAEKKIQSLYPIEKLILDHTMFPQYSRFLPSERKKNALHHLAHEFCDAHQLFAVLPRSDSDRFLKYCPECVAEDRKMHGETYWHRIHQIRNMTICPRHQCLFESSTSPAISAQTYTLCPAEEHTVNLSPQFIENNQLLAFSRYLMDVFNSTFDLENDIPVVLVAGDCDDVVPYEENGALLERFYKQNGGKICVHVKEGCNHHPHGLSDVTVAVNEIERFIETRK